MRRGGREREESVELQRKGQIFPCFEVLWPSPSQSVTPIDKCVRSVKDSKVMVDRAHRFCWSYPLSD